MSYIELTSAEIEKYFDSRMPSLTRRGREWRGPCPIHNGHDDNFAVKAETGQWHCHSQCQRGGDVFTLEQTLFGCDFREAVERVGEIVGRSLSTESRTCRHVFGSRRTFDYQTDTGECRFQVYREDCLHCDRKSIRQGTPDGQRSLDGIEKLPYNLPGVVTAATVYVVEGEPKVHALADWGLIGTCNPGGAGNWIDQYNRYLHDKHVVILPDNDDAGRRHALSVAQQLADVARSMRILELPGLPPKGDIVDWQRVGHTKQEFERLVAALPSETAGTLAQIEERWFAPEPELMPEIEQPLSLDPAAYYGISGEFLKLVGPHTEADPAALLFTFNTMLGSYLLRNAYYLADGSRHYVNEFTVIVGDSSKGRKGTSWNQVAQVMAIADSEFLRNNITSGLSSGEGLIWAVRDEIVEHKPTRERGKVTDYQDIVVDPGVSDKRLLVQESELARALKAMQRDANTLSPVLRSAWDDGNLRIITRSSPATATNAHISILAHITSDELKKLLTNTETANGFANRFLWCNAKRSKCLPFGGSLNPEALRAIADGITEIAAFAASVERVTFDQFAAEKWAMVYPSLSEGNPGLAGAVTSRNEAHAVRLALLYALLDLSPVIRVEHLEAALAIIEYSEASARRIFGDSLGDDTADEILGLLKKAGTDGCTRTEIFNHFGRNKASAEIARALALLESRGFACMNPESTNGRPAERWFATSRVRNKRNLRRNPAAVDQSPAGNAFYA